ncbi:unnamed protein product [Closterium sp. NIES-53]
MVITIYFIATSLPDRLASVRDALILKHPSELTIEVLDSALKDVESNLQSVASTSRDVPPPLFHGCTVPQLPTFTASLATSAADVTAAAVRGRSGRRGSLGVGGGGGGSRGGVASGGDGSTEVGGATRAAASDSPTAAGGAAAAATPLVVATVAVAAIADSGARVRTASAVTWCRPPSLHLSRSERCSSRPPLWPYPPTGLGASVAEVPVFGVGTCVDTSLGAAPEDTSLSFTLDSGASHCFFHDHTMLTLLPAPVSVALAGPTLGPVTAHYTITLPCPAVPSGFLAGFHVPSFSKTLVGVKSLVSSHVGVWIEPSVETAVCVNEDTAVAAAAPAVAAAAAAAATAPDHFAVSCSCRSLAHPTVLWHHHLGHPSIPRLRAMSSQRLVLGLPRVLPSLPPSLATPCGPCIEGRLRATPHSSSLRSATEPFETLHLDV